MRFLIQLFRFPIERPLYISVICKSFKEVFGREETAVKLKTVQLMKGDKIKHKEKQVFLTGEGSCCKQRGCKFLHCCTIWLAEANVHMLKCFELLAVKNWYII